MSNTDKQLDELEAPQPEADEWPLLCMELIHDDGEPGYCVVTDCSPLIPGRRVFRCRRVPGSRAIDSVVGKAIDSILEWIDTEGALLDWAANTFGYLSDHIASTHPGAEEALKRWADEWLEVDAFELGPEVTDV